MLEKPGQGPGGDWELAHEVVKEQCLWGRATDLMSPSPSSGSRRTAEGSRSSSDEKPDW